MQDPLAIDVARLEPWLRANIANYSGPLTLDRFAGGQSNPTYLLTTPSRRYVLRRKPPGVLLPSAHAVDREHRVLTALAGTPVPVPQALALCTDETVIGTWFYLMEHVEGRTFWDPTLPEVDGAVRREYFRAMTDALARLHRVDYRAVGLADFGRPHQYLERQLARWGKQYQDDAAAGRVADLDRLIDWLQANKPAREDVAIVHGDYRCDNLLFHPTEPRVLAILDWELATLGDPLADFAYFLMIYRLPTLAFPGLAGIELTKQGLPSEAECVADYCRQAGRERIANLDYYLAFCLFRLAAIFHGIRGRVIRGTAVSAKAREYAKHVEITAAIGWAQAERAKPEC